MLNKGLVVLRLSSHNGVLWPFTIVLAMYIVLFNFFWTLLEFDNVGMSFLCQSALLPIKGCPWQE